MVDSDDEPEVVNEYDRFTVMRYEHFRAAAEYVAAAFAGVPAVKRVALFGSVASTPRLESHGRRRGHIHEPKDVDVAVWLDNAADLNELRRLRSRAVSRLLHEREIGVAHHQVDVFLLDASGRYVGRLCTFNECPKHKPECRAEGCGTVPFLRQHDGFVFDTSKSLHSARIQILYDRDRRTTLAHLPGTPS